MNEWEREREEKLQRLVSWARGIPAPPWRIECEITDHCNSRCIFCWQRSSPRALNVDDSKEMSAGKWLELVDITAKMGVREWHICGGGEPLTRRDVSIPVMLRIKELGMKGEITTNGTLFKKEDIEALVKAGWDQVEISMEAPIKEVNDYLRGIPYSFDAVTAAFKEFNRWKGKTGSQKPRLLIAGVLTNRNYRLLPEFMRFTYEMGCVKLSMNPMVISNPPYEPAYALKIQGKDAEELPKYIIEAKAIADELKLETNIDDFLDTRYVCKTGDLDEVIREDDEKMELTGFCAAHCYLPWQVMAIRPYGLVGPCVLFNDEEGDSVKEMSLEEIWEGDYFNRIRQQILDRNFPSYCARCCPPFVIEGRAIQRALKQMAIHPPSLLSRLKNSFIKRVKNILVSARANH